MKLSLKTKDNLTGVFYFFLIIILPIGLTLLIFMESILNQNNDDLIGGMYLVLNFMFVLGFNIFVVGFGGAHLIEYIYEEYLKKSFY